LSDILEKDKRELAEELLWLRQTSKNALQKSWNEVEHLQGQCADHVEVVAQLTATLKDSREEKEVWRLRYLTLDKTKSIPFEQEHLYTDNHIPSRSVEILLGTNKACSCRVNNDMQSSSEKKYVLNLRDKIRAWSYGNIRGPEDETTNSLSMELGKMRDSSQNQSTRSIDSCTTGYRSAMDEDIFTSARINDTPFHESIRSGSNGNLETAVHITADTSIANHLSLHGNVKSQEELSLIISSRDKIIVSLEHTLNQQLSNLQNMQAEMVCLMKAQHIRERRLSTIHKQNKERPGKLVESDTSSPRSDALFHEIRNLQRRLSTPHTQKEGHSEKLVESRAPSPSDDTPFHDDMCSRSDRNSHGIDTANMPEEECIVETVVQTAGDYRKKNQHHLHDNAKPQDELSLIISSRDKKIVSLEPSLNQYLKIIQNMQAEMICLMEAQRIREKNLSSSHKQKEECLRKLVESLRKKLETYTMCAKEYDIITV